ncbi:MAG: hypothetical protein WCK72_07100, partial [Actinomycetes bacterium]
LVSGGYLSDPEGSITSSNFIVRTQYQLQLNSGVIGIAGSNGAGFVTTGVSNCTSSINDTQQLSAPGGTGGTGGSASPTPSPGTSISGCTTGSCIAPTPGVTVSPAPSVSPSGFVPSATPSPSGTYPNPATSFSATPIPTFTKGGNKVVTITGVNLTNVAGVWMGTKPVTSWSIDPTYSTLTAVQPGGGQTGVHIYIIFTNGTWWTSPDVYNVG